MRNWTHITMPILRESPAHLRLRSLATRLELVLAGVVVFGFSVRPAVAQQPGAPATDVSNIPRPITDTFERVRMRDAPNDARAGQKTAEKEDTCLLPPLTLVRSPIVATTALGVPKKAKKEYLEACAALKEKKADGAEKHLRQAVREYPKYSAAWVTLGQMLAAQNRSDEARSACSQGSTVEATYVPAYLCLADLAAREKAWDDVLKLSSRALELDPSTNAIAYEYNAAANLRTNKLDDAEKSALRALAIDKNNSEPRVHFVLAQIYEAKGDRANEAAQLREYLKFASNPDDVVMVKQYLSQLEEAGK
jgi:predicted Zn-dependent protease